MQTITAWSYLLVKQTYVDINISIKDNREQVVGLSMFSLQSNELEMISIALLNLIRFVYNRHCRNVFLAVNSFSIGILLLIDCLFRTFL